MICPICESENVQSLPTFIACVDCGCTTAAVFTPSGKEKNTKELLLALWTRRVMAFSTPLGERPQFFWSKRDKWSAKIALAPEPFLYLDTPDEAIDFLIAGLQIEQSIAPTRAEHINQLYEAELVQLGVDAANERYLERVKRDLHWTQAVEAMSNL